MISPYALTELAKKCRTTELNMRREYIQHLFLSYFYKQPQADTILFKGGTALRVVFASPRFSEDLDFSATLSDTVETEEAMLATLKEIEREGIGTEILESKETSGGYLSDISFRLRQEQVRILLQFSKRKSGDRGEVITITNEFVPPYTLVMLDRRQLVTEKIQALLTRSKPRDFYDLYFMIRANLLQKQDKQMLTQVKKTLHSTNINFEQELKQFLPNSHWPIIRNLAISLDREIDRFT